VGYIEKQTDFQSNMTALVAEDATFTSAPHMQGLALNPNNIVVQMFSENPHMNTTFHSSPITSTQSSVTFCIANPTVNDGDVHHHHEGRRLVDLAALQADIIQTFTTFSAFLSTLAPSHVPTNTIQPTIILPELLPTVTMTTTSTPMNGYDDDSHNDDHADDDARRYENQQPVDLLAFQ